MGIGEIIIIAVVILVLFGAKKIPEMMKGVGRGIRQFNEEKGKPVEDDDDDVKRK